MELSINILQALQQIMGKQLCSTNHEKGYGKYQFVIKLKNYIKYQEIVENLGIYYM